MKKLFCIAVLSLFSMGAFAQLPVNLGLKLGWNSSKISTSNLSTNLSDYSPTNNNGYLIGAFGRLNIKSFFIQPEVYFAVKKGATSVGFSGEDGQPLKVTQDIDLKTFDIPMLLGYRVLDLKVLSMQVFTGPVMSINTEGSSVSITNMGGLADDAFAGLKDPSGVNWAYQLGLGFDIALFTIDARYEWGLSNIDTGSIAAIKDISFDQKSNMFTLSVGWRFL